MAHQGFVGFDPDSVPSPCYVVDEALLKKNLEVLAGVQSRTGCTILLALKGFAMWSTFPLIRQYLKGVTASSPHEAQLGKVEFGGETHAYAPAYSDEDFPKYLDFVDHISFNSLNQWKRFRPVVEASGKKVSCALRINPEHSEVKVALYDPCAKKSRLGVRVEQIAGESLDGLEGLHFHTLCELNSDALERTLKAVEEKFGDHIRQMKWINFGGGHHITRPDYDVDLLCRLVSGFMDKYGVQVYLEPGEAIALNTGILVATVLDIFENDMQLAILDTSATAHMPDVLEMPYRPIITGGGNVGEFPHTYRLGGLTCLAGDVIGDWSFEEPLHIGDKLIFGDMAHYTMVKNTTFNGVRLPSIAIYNSETKLVKVIRNFGYEDYKDRLS
ncbi:MAG: carboxynorspermidine decarboxylase [Candidatus Hydrogenedentota bacterium]